MGIEDEQQALDAAPADILEASLMNDIDSDAHHPGKGGWMYDDGGVAGTVMPEYTPGLRRRSKVSRMTTNCK